MYKISVTAGANYISEFGQQLAWLSSTLQVSPVKSGVTAIRPRIEKLVLQESDREEICSVGTCSFTYNLETSTTSDQDEIGFCWARLFCNPVLVTGYPTLRRPSMKSGLEMSLGTMAFLAQSNQVMRYGARTMLKGFRTLFVATAVSENIISWHVLTSGSQDADISYFDCRLDALPIQSHAEPSLDSFKEARHFVGWCSKATDFCGKHIHALT